MREEIAEINQVLRYVVKHFNKILQEYVASEGQQL
jgi:hypothetical protein